MTKDSSLPGPAPSRRQLVCGMAALAGAGAAMPPWSAALAAIATETPPTGFLARSTRLTGVALDQVDQDQATRVWSALLPAYGRERLETVVRVAALTPDDAALTAAFTKAQVLDAAQALTRAWYTGSTVTAPTTSVLFYDAALAWRVCAFTKPAANCGGVFGYWEQPWQPPATGQESHR